MAVEWITDFSAAITAFRGAIGLLRDVRDALPKEQQKAVDLALEQADKAAQIAEAQIAKGLGYPLCTCTFPPQIMLLCRDGTMHPPAAEYHKCPTCGREAPSQFARQRKSKRMSDLDRLDDPNAGQFDPQ